jgi:hypothetical protein
VGNKRNGLQWRRHFAKLARYAAEHGHCFVPRSYTAKDGFRLGIWTGEQRRRRHAHPEDDRRALEALPNWTWDATDARWRMVAVHVEAFSRRHGHLNIPEDHCTPEGVPLARWLTAQQRDAQRGRISATRLEYLRGIVGWTE